MALSTALSTGRQATNQYDIQRQNIRDEEQRRRKEEQDALQRRLASRGFGAGTGYTETQQMKTDIASREGERQRLSGVDVSQLASQEAADEAERQRQWQTGERTGSEEAAARAAEAGRTWQTGERTGTQTWQSTEALQDRALRQQEIDNAAANAQSRQDFDYWAAQAGYTDAERQRAWEERQSALQREAATGEAEAQRSWETEMAGYRTSLERGTLQLQDQMDTNRAATKTHMDYLFQLGATGIPIDTSGMNQMELDAYGMGRSGKAKEDYDKYIDNKIGLRDQLILTLVESPELKNDITTLWNKFEELTGGASLYGRG